jgi:surface antigen
MKKFVAVSCVVALTACAEMDMQNANIGGIAGAVVGGLAGGMVGAEFGGGLGQTLFMGAGALVGAGVGYEAGTLLYPSDQAAYDNNARLALNHSTNGSVSQWSNPETGNGGIFTPTNAYVTADGRSCRGYRATLALKKEGAETGVIAHQDGTACQQADGSWRSVNENFG